MNFLWMVTLSIQYSNEMQQLYKNSVLPIFYQMFTRPKVLVCIKRQFVNYTLHSMNYCALSHYLRGHVTNKQLNIMHFCWRSLDDKSLSSLLELRKNVFPMHVYKYCKNYMLKVYGYDYGMIYFDTRLWYFTQDEENNFQHSKHKGYV